MLKPPTHHDHETTRDEQHRTAVLDAEVHLLADQLAEFGGILPRDELGRRGRASLWREGRFEAALRAGVDRGVLVLPPEGLVALRRRD